MPVTPLTSGYTWSGTSPNNVVTAEKLNAQFSDAVINPTFISQQTEDTQVAATDYILKLDAATGEYRKVSGTNAFVSAKGVAHAKNLVMFNNASTPNSKVDVTADFILMRRASNGALYVSTSFSATADIALGVAVNGLDAGTEAANTFYFLHAISNGTLDRLLLSTSATSPTLPSGYVYSCLLGVVQNDNSSNFRKMSQHGNEVAIDMVYDGDDTGDALHMNPRTGSVDFTSANPATSPGFESAFLSRCIPPNIVAAASGIIGVTGTTAVVAFIGVASSAGTGSLASPATVPGMVFNRLTGFVPTNGSTNADPTHFMGFQNAFSFRVPVKDSQTIAWATSNSGGIHSMRITGFTLALH